MGKDKNVKTKKTKLFDFNFKGLRIEARLKKAFNIFACYNKTAFHQCCIFILQVVTDGAKVRGFITHANGKPSWKDGSLKNKRMLSPLAKLTKVRAFNWEKMVMKRKII